MSYTNGSVSISWIPGPAGPQGLVGATGADGPILVTKGSYNPVDPPDIAGPNLFYRSDIPMLLGWTGISWGTIFPKFVPPPPPPPPPPNFQFKVFFSEPGSFELPIYGGGVEYIQDFVVDWGDSSSDFVGAYNHETRIHNYAIAGTYLVKMTGTCQWFGFYNGPGSGKIIEIISVGSMGFKVLNFQACYALATIVPLGIQTNLLNAADMFNGCENLSEIPAELFAGCSGMQESNAFNNTFFGCESLETIPSGLFDQQTGLTENAFNATFCNCSGLLAVPSGLFDYQTGLTVDAFNSTFYGCGALETIPAGLFDYQTELTENAFISTFQYCTSLPSIPTGIFDNQTLLTTGGFLSTFSDCPVLASYGAYLFKNNTNCTTFKSTFENCANLQIRPDTFYGPGESATRFLNQSVDFSYCFKRSSFTGAQGAAPDIWVCDFGTGAPTKTSCFGGDGNSLASLDNYGSIEATWL